MMLKVSVIIPTHNRLSLLKEAINSVLMQTEQNFEIIVIDDASTDGTFEYLLAVQMEDSRIKFLSNKVSVGGAEARNLGIEDAKGKWIAFLDDDDKWMPQKLQKQLMILSKFPKAVACSAAYLRERDSGIMSVVKTPNLPELQSMFLRNSLGGASVCMCKASIIRRIGGFDKFLESGQDWDLWIRLRMLGDIVSLEIPLVLYRDHQGERITRNISAQYQGLRNIYRKYQNMMVAETQRHHIISLCYFNSLLSNKTIFQRLRWLFLATFNSPINTSMRYTKNWLIKIIKDLNC